MSSLFPQPPVSIAPDGTQYSFYQGKWWRNSANVFTEIDEMSIGYVDNVMAFLLRNAAVFARRVTTSMYAYAATAPDGAADAIEMEISNIEDNPEAWLKDTPIYRALKKRRKRILKALKKSGANL